MSSFSTILQFSLQQRPYLFHLPYIYHRYNVHHSDCYRGYQICAECMEEWIDTQCVLVLEGLIIQVWIIRHCDRVDHIELSSVQFSSAAQACPTLWLHEPQHARPPCPSPAPSVYSNSCPSSRWCHPATSSSVVPFSSCPQSLPASGSFPMSQLFAWGDQSTGGSASASVFPMNTQDWSPSGWTGWISLQSKGESSPTPQFKSINFSARSFLHSPTLTSIHDRWKSLDQMDLCWQSNVSAF